MCKSHFVMLGVMFWALVGVLSLPYESIGIGEFTVKTLQYTILGGGFGVTCTLVSKV